MHYFRVTQRAYSRTTHKKCAKVRKIIDMRKKNQKNLRISEKSSNFATDFDTIMSELIAREELDAMRRRLVYMIVAIAASWLMFLHPVFNFQDDKGIIYVRSFSMDQKMFYVTQTDIKTGAAETTAMTSVAWLYYCNKAMLWGSILCLLCVFSDRLRIAISYITTVVSGFYYVLIVYYAMKLSDLHYTTLYPNYMIVLPAIVCAMMILTSRNIIHTHVDRADREMERYNAE